MNLRFNPIQLLGDRYTETKTDRSMTSLNVQICEDIEKAGYLKIAGNPNEKKPVVYILENGKWNRVSKNDLGKFCKVILRKYLNKRLYTIVSSDDNTDPIENIDVDGICISAESLQSAYAKNFELGSEKRALVEEIFDTVGLYQEPEYFQAPNHIVPCKNGYYDLKDGCLYSYGYNGFVGSLYTLNASYRSEYVGVSLPQAFLNLIRNAILNPVYTRDVNEARVQSFLDFLAYAFIPTNPHRKMFVIIGPTACGKSTIVAIIRAVFGDLGTHLQSDSIMKRNRYDNEMRSDLESAMDMMWLDISETDNKQTIDAVTVKSWTGNDPLTFRKPHSDIRTMKLMKAKIFIVTNTFPKILNYDDVALQDRMILIDFHNTVIHSARISNLVSTLTTEENLDIMATFFLNRAKDLYHTHDLFVEPTFQYNIMRYFVGQGDAVVQFYDNLNKVTFDLLPMPINTISIDDLAQLFIIYRTKQLGIEAPFSDSDKRAFEMKFAEIAKAEKFHFVKNLKYTNGHFYTGICIPFENRRWLFNIPINNNFASMNNPKLLS